MTGKGPERQEEGTVSGDSHDYPYGGIPEDAKSAKEEEMLHKQREEEEKKLI